MKTADLIGPALDWAVAKCEGKDFMWLSIEANDSDGAIKTKQNKREYSTDWSVGGPIIERGGISVNAPSNGTTIFKTKDGTPQWRANNATNVSGRGSTPLIAAMRCYVASRLGDTIYIPEELQ